MFEQTFKNIDDILHKDAGCSSELDYVEQTSLVLFLKYMDDFEKDRKTAAELAGKTYNGIIDPDYRWDRWASATFEAEAAVVASVEARHGPWVGPVSRRLFCGPSQPPVPVMRLPSHSSLPR